MALKSSWEAIRKILKRLGTPAGADIATDIANLENEITDAVSQPPTAKSLQDMLHKDGNYTFDNTTDALEAIRDAIDSLHNVPTKDSTDDNQMRDVAGKKDDTARTTVGTTRSTISYIKGILNTIVGLNDISIAQVNAEVDSALSDYDSPTRTEATSDKNEVIAVGISGKEKSLLGIISGVKGLNEVFDNVVADAVPDTNIWNAVETGGTVRVRNVSTTLGFPYCELKAITTNGNDAIIYTKNKKHFGLNQITTLFFKAKFSPSDLSARFGVGFIPASISPTITSSWNSNNQQATIWCTSNVIEARSYNAAEEVTNISAYFGDGTRVTVEIRITASDVKFYIDGALRATHSTQVPLDAWQVGLAATRWDGIDITMNIEYVEVWAE